MTKLYKNVNGEKVELTEEEISQRTKDTTKSDKEKLQEIRAKREKLFPEADFKINMLSDTGADATKWRTYRQALRDITKGNLNNPTWPTKPSQGQFLLVNKKEDNPPDDNPSDDVSDNLLLWIEKKDKQLKRI